MKQLGISKILGPLLVFFVATSPLNGQSMLTLRTGVNFASMGGSMWKESTERVVGSRKGLNLGASLLLPVSDNTGFQLGVAYSVRGANVQVTGQEIKGGYGLNYLDVPVLFKVNAPSEGVASVHFLVGPSIGFNLGCEVEALYESATMKVDCDEVAMTSEDIQSVEFGAAGGLGMDIKISDTFTMVVDALYNFGISSIDPVADVKNRAFTIQVGAGFPLG